MTPIEMILNCSVILFLIEKVSKQRNTSMYLKSLNTVPTACNMHKQLTSLVDHIMDVTDICRNADFTYIPIAVEEHDDNGRC